MKNLARFVSLSGWFTGVSVARAGADDEHRSLRALIHDDDAILTSTTLNSVLGKSSGCMPNS